MLTGRWRSHPGKDEHTPSGSGSPSITVEQVDVRRGRAFRLSVDRLRLSQGLTVLRGQNASGKSTLLECLSGGRRRNVGNLDICGYRPLVRSEQKAAYQRLGYVPQPLVLPSSWTVMEYLAYAGWLKGLSKQESHRRIHDVSDTLAFTERLAARIGKLSGGYRRRILVAQALLGQPRVLLADEPFAGLDYESQEVVAETLRWHAKEGVVVLADHTDAMLAEADRALLLADGRLAT